MDTEAQMDAGVEVASDSFYVILERYVIVYVCKYVCMHVYVYACVYMCVCLCV
jgi:hypothetical protein